MALDEAIRLVTVCEGNKISEIPALQALLRTMFRTAAQGDAKAARQLLDLIARAESSRAATAVQVLEFAAQYKERLRFEFELNERLGRDPPEIYPHPDDVLINENTGEVTIDGPRDKDQAGAHKAVRQQAIESLPRYFEVVEERSNKSCAEARVQRTEKIF